MLLLCRKSLAMLAVVVFLVAGMASAIRDESQAHVKVGDKATRQSPHILFVLADDLGYNELGFQQRSSPVNPNGELTTMPEAQVDTPNIDALAKESVILENYYVQPMCTPSRAALLTGRYHWRMGMGPYVQRSFMAYGLPGGEKTMANMLSDAGYATHMIGKWHLGMSEPAYYPTNRGFGSFLGYLGGCQDYSTHRGPPFKLLDFRRMGLIGVDDHQTGLLPNNNTHEYDGRDSSEVFAERAKVVVEYWKENQKDKSLFLYFALQNVHSWAVGAPAQVLEDVGTQFDNNLKAKGLEVEESTKVKIKMSLAMVKAMDIAVGKVVQEFKNAGIWDNTVFVFSNDNGGVTKSPKWPGGGNFPLRGAKVSTWEGGYRGIGFVRGPGITSGKYAPLTHISDWLPTLVGGAAKVKLDPSINFDGFNLWPQLVNPQQEAEPRKDIMLDCPWESAEYSLDADPPKLPPAAAAAYRWGDYKLIISSSTEGEDPYEIVSPVTGAWKGWENASSIYPIEGWSGTATLMCDPPEPYKGMYLFDIAEDPKECTNLLHVKYDAVKDTLEEMLEKLKACQKEAVKDLDVLFRELGAETYRAFMAKEKSQGDEIASWNCATDEDFAAKVPEAKKEWFRRANGKTLMCGWPVR